MGDAQGSYRESDSYAPGDEVLVVESALGRVGVGVCYDLRFPEMFRRMLDKQVDIIVLPSAFTRHTGWAHWLPLLRARAIETGCFVLAPAQTGTHRSEHHKTRDTYGHSLVVAPWGEVILDAGERAGVYLFDLDPNAVDVARTRVPSMANRRPFADP